MIQVSFDKFADFRDELAARLAKVREETVRVWIRRRAAAPFTVLEVIFTAVVSVEPAGDADLLRCVTVIGPYETSSLDAGECERLSLRTRELNSGQLIDMGLQVRGGEYLPSGAAAARKTPQELSQ
jgi:hypothetical protein